jgi:hypothetical protein
LLFSNGKLFLYSLVIFIGLSQQNISLALMEVESLIGIAMSLERTAGVRLVFGQSNIAPNYFCFL